MAYTAEFLSAKRLIGDPLADEFIARNFTDLKSKTVLYNWLQQLDSNQVLADVPLDFSSSLTIDAQILPPWADAQAMAAGAAFFIKHAEQIMQLLGLLSLPYCYAAADGAMVLYLSQQLKDHAAKRLGDTAEFIWDVMSPNAFTKEGKGFSSILKIRLMHAAARYYTLKSGKWNDAWGFPVNQEDTAGTNLAFSLIVIRGLRKMGHSISYADQQAYLHLWGVIGHLLGLDVNLIPKNGKDANELEAAIRERHFKSSEQGRELTKSLISVFEKSLPKGVTLKETLQLMRYLLGDPVAEILGLKADIMPGYVPFALKTSNDIRNLKSASSSQTAFQQKYNAFKKQAASIQ